MSTHPYTIVTTADDLTTLSASAPPGARIPVEIQMEVVDPFDAYRRARTDDWRTESGVYFETTGGQSGWGYFGVDPIRRVEVGSEVEPVGDETQSASISELANVLDRETLVRGECEVPYPCGAFGWLSYDVARELESLPDTTVDDRALPRLQLAVFDRVAAWEEPRPDGTRTLHVTACPRVEGDPEAAYERGLDRAVELVHAISNGEADVGPPPVSGSEVPFESDSGRRAYAERVRRVKEYVRDGDTFQTNVSQRLRAPAAVHPVEAFAALRRVNPAPYSALVEFPGVDLVSASPELLLDVAPADDGTDEPGLRLRTEPIAGTRPRGATTAADEALATELLTDEKERAEHAMLVDLERNDLGKVAEFGSVEVTEYRRIDRYAEVMHLVSLVEGRLRTDRTIADAIAAVFPGGTITGAPKPRTMEIIDELEESRRGPYTGSIGVFGFDGRVTCNMVIRTLVRRADEYSLRVGAGIVHDSEPEREYEETMDKGRALVRALNEAMGERVDLAVEEPGVAD